LSSTKLIRAAETRRMPWKNGGGETWEIARDVETDDYGWRLSVAEVRQSGPFSAFPGYERIIVQLAGPPMRLTHPTGTKELGALVPYSFSGDVATEGTVTEPARDFNVLYKRGRIRAQAEALIAAGDHVLMSGPPGTLALHIVRGAAMLLRGEGETPLLAGDTLLVTSDSPFVASLRAAAGTAYDALVVRLTK